MHKVFCIVSALLISALNVNAQTPGEEYNHNGIFKGFLGWDVRAGGENSSFSTANINYITGEVMSSYKGTYKNSRVNIDALVIDGAMHFGKRFQVGIPYGFNVGLGPQNKKYTDESTGTNPITSWPSGYGGNQGMEIGEKMALSFELKLGLAAAYKIIPAKNFQVSVGYNYRFWSKSNLAFYTLPKFLGGFVDVNFTYKRWALATTFRTNKDDSGLVTGMQIKSGYFSMMPTYNIPLRNKEKKFRNGLNTIGLRLETSSAKGSGSYTDNITIYQSTLKARTFMMGVYFGFLL